MAALNHPFPFNQLKSMKKNYEKNYASCLQYKDRPKNR